MLVRTILLALTVTLPAVALSAQVSPATNNDDSDDKVACIVDFVGSEQDESTHDAFIEECMQKKIAARQASQKPKG